MSLLVTYSESSEEETEDDSATLSSSDKPRKRRNSKLSGGEEGNGVNGSGVNAKKRLPAVPVDIQNMFGGDAENLPVEELTDHQGRVRSFAHERGNWASYVFIPASNESDLEDLSSTIVENLAPHVELKPVDDFHLSLSRTFVLRHHWIDSFVSTVRDNLSSVKSFVCEFGELEVYCNDEKTRTFVGFKVCTGNEKLKNLTNAVDKCLKQFKLPTYYEDPSFHISIAWALGDVSDVLNSTDCQGILKESLEEQLDIQFGDQLTILNVKKTCCKIGNRLYEFPTVGR